MKCLHKYNMVTDSKLVVKYHNYSIQYINKFVVEMGQGFGEMLIKVKYTQ